MSRCVRVVTHVVIGSPDQPIARSLFKFDRKCFPGLQCGTRFALLTCPYNGLYIPVARIQKTRSPDDPDLRSYWERREARKAEPLPTWRQRELAKRQGGHCPICHDSLHDDRELRVQHVIPKSQSGEDALSNLTLVHLYCHQQTHKGRKVNV